MKGVQCYELFGGIALKNHTFSFFSFSKDHFPSKCSIECIISQCIYREEHIRHFSSFAISKTSDLFVLLSNNK